MFRLKKNLVPILAAGLALILAGCIVSGTFVLDYKITDAELAKYDHLFYKQIDLTDEDVWQDHEENLDEVQSVGFEMWINNVGPQTTFDLYVDGIAKPIYTDTSDVNDNATKVVQGLTLAANKQTHITYGSSFKYLINVNVLTKLARTGMFNFYAIWTQESTITIDSLRVVVVLSASDS